MLILFIYLLIIYYLLKALVLLQKKRKLTPCVVTGKGGCRHRPSAALVCDLGNSQMEGIEARIGLTVVATY